MFDKKAYAERRKKHLRGQEDLTPPPAYAKWTEEDFAAGKCGAKAVGSDRNSGVAMHMTKKGLVAVPRRLNRQKVVDRHTTKKGFVYGTKIGSKAYGILQSSKRKFTKEHKDERIPSEEQRIHLENYPLRINPSKTNHQRMLERKEKRDADTKARREAVSATPAAV